MDTSPRTLDDLRAAVAAHGDDPLRAAVAEWNHSLFLMFDGAYPAALRSIERAETVVSLAPAHPAVPAVRGALHLRAVIIAARATNPNLAARHLVDARSLAVDALPPADAMVVAPLTCNSLAKWAAGISDTLPLGLLVEAVGKRQPVVAMPFSNRAQINFPAIHDGLAEGKK